MAEQYVIEFVGDFKKLDSQLDQLVSSGQIDSKLATTFKEVNAELAKGEATTEKLISVQKKLIRTLDETKGSVDNAAQAFIEGFSEGVLDTLKEAGVSVEEFEDKLKEGMTAPQKSTVNLKKRLKEVKAEMASLIASGQENTEAFRRLAKEGGNLTDTLGDISLELKNLGSDTFALDGLVQGTQLMAAGFAVSQGAAALFGDESEELQKTLLKVNAAMSIMQGLQQIQTVLQKQTSLSRLADVVAMKAQVVTTQLYTFVMNGAVIATKALRAALVTTGIGAVVVGLGFLISKLIDLTDAQEDANESVEEFNGLLDAELQGIENYGKKIDLELQRAGAKESERIRMQGKNILAQRDAVHQQIIAAEKKFALNQTEEQTKYIQGLYNKRTELTLSAEQKSIDYAKAVADEKKKIADDGNKATEAARKKALENERKGVMDEIAVIEQKIIASKKGSVEELELRQQLLNKKADLEVLQEGLTANQIILIRAQAAKDIADMEMEFQKGKGIEALKIREAQLKKDLADVNITEQQKMEIRMRLAKVQLSLELKEAGDNRSAQLVAENNYQETVFSIKKQYLDEAFNYEDRLQAVRLNRVKRAAQVVLSNEKSLLSDRLLAITAVENEDKKSVQLRMDRLKGMLDNNLISRAEYNVALKELQDQETQIVSDAEQQRTTITTDDASKRKAQRQKEFEEIAQFAQQALKGFGTLAASLDEAQLQRIASLKGNLEGLRETGAITEKEYKLRLKRLDDEEKKVRLKAAKREKVIAIFDAAIATAVSVTKVLYNPVLAGIVAALGAIQIAAIAAKPIPKFKRGTSYSPEGLAIVGEAGAELIESPRGKKMIASQEQLVFLQRGSKVYNAEETRRMIERETPTAQKGIEKHITSAMIDYEKMANTITEAMIKTSKGVNIHIDKDGFLIGGEQYGNFQKYLSKKYRS